MGRHFQSHDIWTKRKHPYRLPQAAKIALKKKNSNGQDIKLENSILIDVSDKFCL